METQEITHHEDIIDSRDVIARIKELESELKTAEADEDMSAEQNELKTLKALEEKASCSPDWPHGEILINDNYFEEYAEDYARDMGAISSDVQWPQFHIDWTAAANALRQDYIEVDFDGVAYQIRA